MTINPLIYIVLLNAMLSAAYLVTSSLFMKRGSPLHFIAVLTYTHLVAGAILLALWLSSNPINELMLIPPSFWPYIACAVLFNMASKLMYLYAYSKIAVANVTIFSSFTPLFAFFTAWMVIEEIPDMKELSGVILVVIGVYYFHLKVNEGASFFNNVLQPIKNIFQSRPSLFAFLSTVPPAFSIVYSKQAILTTSPLLSSALSLLFMGAMSFIVEWMVFRKPFFPNLPYKRIFILSILLSFTALTAAQAIIMGKVASIMSLQRLSIFFQVIFAYFLLQEKIDLKKKLLAIIIVFIGSILLY